MKTLALVVTLVACASPRSRPLENQGPSRPATEASITGTITDAKTAEPLAGVTVIVLDERTEKPAGEAVITDERGLYRIEKLEPGRYRVNIYYLDLTVTRRVHVRGAIVVDQELDQDLAGGEVRHCESAAASSCK